MEKERLQEYAARVTQANRSELVVIIYEATLASIEEGKKYLKQGEIEAARHEIERARSMITELMASLDLQYEISHYLRQLSRRSPRGGGRGQLHRMTPKPL